MPLSVLPSLRARRFSFEGDACLYRDHQGRRVLADAEGCGRLVVERAAPGLGTDAAPDGSFRDGVVAFSRESGASAIAMLQGGGRDLPGSGKTLEVASSFLGAGWVVECDGPLTVDAAREPSPAPTPRLPIPFFLEARGARLRVTPRPFHAVSVDRFSIADADGLKARDFRVQNMSDVEPLASVFSDGGEWVGPVASHLNTASWSAPVPPGAFAIVLRKTYDRFHGRQRARVLLDGEFSGYWYEPEEDRHARWGVSDFCALLPRERGETLRIGIDPVAGSPLWSVSTVEVLALVRS